MISLIFRDFWSIQKNHKKWHQLFLAILAVKTITLERLEILLPNLRIFFCRPGLD